MAELANIKEHLVNEAVQSNVDVIRGQYRFRKPTKEQRAGRHSRIFFFLSLPLALFFASYVASSIAESWIDLQSAEVAERVATDVRAANSTSADLAAADAPRKSAPSNRAFDEDKPGALAAAATLDRTVFPLGVKKIIIDPGHGGDNTGTVSPSGLVEKTIALDISERLSELLEQAEFDVALTRTTDTFVSLEERAEIANEAAGDLFVSIHLNWIATRQTRGVETFYLGLTDDPYLTQLAASENQDSGYSLADFRQMLDRVFADVRQDESSKLASAVQRSLYNSLRRVNPTLQDRGVKKAPFIVLTGTEMPAILAEVSCLSNEKEARLLMTREYRQFIAEALFRGISGYARELNEHA